MTNMVDVTDADSITVLLARVDTLIDSIHGLDPLEQKLSVSHAVGRLLKEFPGLGSVIGNVLLSAVENNVDRIRGGEPT